MVVSNADTEQTHVGTVYQAPIRLDITKIASHKIRHGNEILHKRTVSARARQANMNVHQYAREAGDGLEPQTAAQRQPIRPSDFGGFKNSF